MYYEFYIDQFFVEQLISGYLLLLSASILCRASPQWGRLLLGSLLGAGFTTLLVCIKLPGLYPLAWMIAAAAAFWRRALSKEWRYNLNCTLCLLTATVCFGGVLEALMALLPLPFMAAVCLAFVLICMGLR
ncbi:MAG: sigma-E processing peptidase SpoIIGA, partial [Lachnospiraceae bacterium]|nr:sigma-E processing peptidase SpoIIGA [Lachnospiraceae bacterium]